MMNLKIRLIELGQWFLGRRPVVRIILLVAATLGVAYLGYWFVAAHIETPVQTDVLLYKSNFSPGQTLETKDFKIGTAPIKGDADDYLTPEERRHIKDYPLLSSVSSGDVVRRSHFLYSTETWKNKISSDFRSLWIPHATPPHEFIEGSHLDLFSMSGQRIAADVILMKRAETGYLILVKKTRIPDILNSIQSGGVVATYRHNGPSQTRRPKKKLSSEVWSF